MSKFKNLPDEEKPRERLMQKGEENLSNVELLEILIKSGTRKYGIRDISINILEKIKDIRNLKNISLRQLSEIEGVTLIKAIEIKAAIELGKRINEKIAVKDVISCITPQNIIMYFNYLFNEKVQEEFYVIYLDNKKNYIKHKLLFKGSINYSIAHPRDIFREAYETSSTYIICIHNHPSGDATPSKEDIKLTQKLKEIGILHAIPLIDHIIIGKDNYYSFYEDSNL